MKLKVLDNNIFNGFNIVSGVTKINKEIFPDKGLSLNSNAILNYNEFEKHLEWFSSEIGFRTNQIKFGLNGHF